MPDTKATSTNPKDLLGDKKIDLTRISAFAAAHEAFAMMDGREKYGSYNWREKEVRAEIYVAACKRHLDAWYEGEEWAEDSLAHHLGHARACLGILIDAMETGNLIDDRPCNSRTKGKLARLMENLQERLAERRRRRAGKAEGFLDATKPNNQFDNSKPEDVRLRS